MRRWAEEIAYFLQTHKIYWIMPLLALAMMVVEKWIRGSGGGIPFVSTLF